MDINSLFVRARFAYIFVPNKSKIINKQAMLISLRIMHYSIADNVVKPIRIMPFLSFEVDYLIKHQILS